MKISGAVAMADHIEAFGLTETDLVRARALKAYLDAGGDPGPCAEIGRIPFHDDLANDIYHITGIDKLAP